jgi:hypothetical protein
MGDSLEMLAQKDWLPVECRRMLQLPLGGLAIRPSTPIGARDGLRVVSIVTATRMNFSSWRNRTGCTTGADFRSLPV